MKQISIVVIVAILVAGSFATGYLLSSMLDGGGEPEEGGIVVPVGKDYPLLHNGTWYNVSVVSVGESEALLDVPGSGQVTLELGSEHLSDAPLADGKRLSVKLLGVSEGEQRARLLVELVEGTFESTVWKALMDDTGRVVELEAPPERIVSIAPSNTEILYAVGAGDLVVAVDLLSNYPAEAVAKQNISTWPSVDIEAVMAWAPDLVLASGINLVDVPTLESHGIVTFTLDPRDIDGILYDITLVGELTNRTEGAAALVEDLGERIDAIGEVVRYNTTMERPMVLYDMGDLWTAGPGTFQDDVITLAGGINIAGETGLAWPQLQKEYVVSKDPAVVLYSPWSGFSAGTPEGLEGLSAVQEGRVHVVNEDWMSRPGPRIVDALEEVFAYLHPELAE